MKKYIFLITTGIISALYIWTIVLGNDLLQPSIASKILRFHVLANSDSDADQAVKEEVRDAVGVYLSPLLKDSENIEDTKQIIEENMQQIITVAKDTLTEYGYSYDVNVRIASADFPEKKYGPYTFPKGEYETLQIVLGEGEGQNWWCVLYPNMCFRGSVFEVVEEEAKEALREVLSPWEYADVFDSGEVEIRFRFLDFFTGK